MGSIVAPGASPFVAISSSSRKPGTSGAFGVRPRLVFDGEKHLRSIGASTNQSPKEHHQQRRDEKDLRELPVHRSGSSLDVDNYRKRLLEFRHPATLPAAKAYPDVVSGLLWEACWRGVSTARQVTSPPLHAQALTVKWWTSAPESLRFGPSEYLLRALSECAMNLDGFWQSVVGRMVSVRPGPYGGGSAVYR
jgi:hypothetical protein